VSHPAVARHYGIPEIDLQPCLLAALKRGGLPSPTPEQLANPKMNWKTPGQVFMNDTVHPNELGHALYAKCITDWLETQVETPPMPPPTLREPLIGEDFTRYHYALLSSGLTSGKHVFRLKVLPDRDPTSKGTRLLIGYFMVGGVPPR
jgi:hypothetical protein